MRMIDLRKWLSSSLILLLAVNVPAGFALGSGDGVSPPAAPTVVKVESEEDFTVALRSDGTVWTWGQNYAGQLGNGAVSEDPRTYPEKVDGLGNVFIKDIAAGDAFVLALDSEGRIWQWGCYIPDFLSCDLHTPITSPSIVTVDGVPLIAEEINAGKSIAMARTAIGEVWTWGSVQKAGWGEPSSEADYSVYSPEPSRVVDESGPLADVVQIAGGFDLAMALKSDGSVWVWGINANRSLGVPGDSLLKLSVATRIDLPNNAVAEKIAASSHSLSSIVVTDQGVFGWSNSGRSLGLGYSDAYLPQHLPFLDGFKDIVVGNQHVYGLTAEGGVIRTTAPDVGIIALPEFNGIESLFAGYDRIFALASSGTVWTAGYNRYAASMQNQSRYAYNLLGNGIMGLAYYSWDTPEYDPLPMLEFDALPPAAEYADLYQEGRNFYLQFDFPVGQYDKVRVELYNDSDTLLDEKEYDRDGDGGFWNYYDSDVILVPGHYRFDVYSYDSVRQKKSEITSIHFELKTVTFTLYLYGAPDGFELAIEAYESGQTVEIEYEVYPGEFYDSYVFEGYVGLEYDLISKTPGYSLSIDEVEVDDGTLYEVHVIPDTDPFVRENDLEIVDGKLRGDSIYLYEPVTGADDIEEYRMYFTDAAGNRIEELEADFVTYYSLHILDLSDGVDIPDGAAYLRLFMVKNGVEQPTYYKLWLEQPQLPSPVVKDLHPAADQLKLEVTFDGLEDESRIGFYKIVAEPDGFSDLAGRTIALLSASQTSYNPHLPEFSLSPRERLVLYLVDKNGFASLGYVPLPVVDNMTGQTGMIPYMEKYYFFEDSIPDPPKASFEDEDPRPGRKAGVVRWTRPPELEQAPFIYDIYYGDSNGNIIGGLARIRQPVDAPAEVEYRLDFGSSLPPGTASLVIVSIAKDYNLFPGGYAYRKTAVIPLNDIVAPAQLVRSALDLAPGEPITLSHIAAFVMQQLSAADPVDVSGDDIFDQRDVRMLLREIAG